MTGEQNPRPPVADSVTGVVLAGVALSFLVGALRMPRSTALWEWYGSPGVAPALLALALLIQAAILAVRGWRGQRRGQRVGLRVGERARSWGLGRVLLALAFCAGFVMLLGRVPFGLLVAALVFGMTVTFHGLDPIRAALLAGGTAVGVVLVFKRLFFVPLP